MLGDNASVGNHNFEVIGIFAATGQNGIDADPARVIYDFLTNPQYGAGFNPASINMTSLYGSGGDASLQTYCRAQGISISPALVSQEQGSSILTRWLQLINCGAFWSDGQLNFVPYGDVAISAGNVLRTATWAIPTPPTNSAGTTPAPSVTVCAAGAFVSDGGVVYAFSGAALAPVGGSPSTGQYNVASGVYTFAGGDENAEVRITFTYAIPVSYVPSLTPIYSLTDLDYVKDGDSKSAAGKGPVSVSRLDPFSLPTIQRIEVLSRSNQYGSVPVEARDQSQIGLYGPRVGSTVTAHEICDEVVIGPIVAQILLQRALYVRARFTWKLGWEFCCLDPMDIIELTDPNLGLTAYPVRILSIEEDDNGLLTFTAEELTVGVSTPVLYPSAGVSGFQPNRAVAAAPVNTPLIYEPPPAMTGNVAQVWVGASGGVSGVADPNWGGAYVSASVDNVTYSDIGTVTAPLRQGVLTANLALASGWDTADTLAVSLVESAGTLTGTSAASAQAGSTLALVDQELLAYELATLTAPHAYSLTGLERGFGGTAAAAHSSGAQFARLDNAVVKYNLPPTWIGVPLYFKFQSFNVFQGGVEALSSCASYTYSPTGIGANGPIAAALATGASLNFGNAGAATQSENWGNASSAINLTINLGSASS